MKRDEFLSELAVALSGLSAEEREQTLSFYAEIIDDRVEDGLSEEEAVAALGGIEKLAGRAERDAQKTEEGEEEEDGYRRMRFECAAESVRSLRASVRNMPVHVMPSQDDRVTIEYYTTRQDQYEARLEGKTLILKRVGGSFDGDLLSFFGMRFHRRQFDVNITVPADFAGEMSLDSSNAAVSLEDINLWGALSLVSSNGRVSLKRAAAASINLASSNARISVEDAVSRAELRARTSNSRIEAARVTAQTALDLVTSNGAITVEQPSAAQLRLRTSNGRISGLIPGAIEDYAIDSGTSNGRNTLPSSKTGGEKTLSCHTSNASINIDFAG